MAAMAGKLPRGLMVVIVGDRHLLCESRGLESGFRSLLTFPVLNRSLPSRNGDWHAQSNAGDDGWVQEAWDCGSDSRLVSKADS